MMSQQYPSTFDFIKQVLDIYRNNIESALLPFRNHNALMIVCDPKLLLEAGKNLHSTLKQNTALFSDAELQQLQTQISAISETIISNSPEVSSDTKQAIRLLGELAAKSVFHTSELEQGDKTIEAAYDLALQGRDLATLSVIRHFVPNIRQTVDAEESPLERFRHYNRSPKLGTVNKPVFL